MSERKYRTYPEEFKLEAMALAENSGKSMNQIERELGITPGLLSKWRARYQITGKTDQTLEPSDLASAQSEIRRLQRELKVVEQERDILKKAISIFSRKVE